MEAVQARDTRSFGIAWDGKFDKSTDARSMVTWRAAAVLGGRWDQVIWLASERAPRKLLGNPFMNYWYTPYVMLSNPFMRMHCKFCYYCARGEGAVYFIFFTSYFLSSCNTLGIAFIIL